jgi:hypothetical protein
MQLCYVASISIESARRSTYANAYRSIFDVMSMFHDSVTYSSTPAAVAKAVAVAPVAVTSTAAAPAVTAAKPVTSTTATTASKVKATS